MIHWESAYQSIEEQVIGISEYLYDYPELGNQEVMASSYLCEQLQQAGFHIEKPLQGLETAFKATLKAKKPGPTIALLAEYDALKGYGENKDQVAHACGHNWIAALCCGVGLMFAKHQDQMQGTLLIIGCPAEETTGGKCELVDKHVFDDIDFALQLHLGAKNNANVVTLAMQSLEFTFKGKAAHAAAYPQLGINALDAVQLTFTGINYLRQQMQSDARVHGIITKGGEAVNTIPDLATCQFYVRAKQKAYMEQLSEKVINCAKGAALMSGATMSYRYFENTYHDLVNIPSFQSLYQEKAALLGVQSFIACDEEASGSSDIGNVSHICPTMYCELAIEGEKPAYAHDEQFLTYMKSEYANDKLKKGVLSLVYCIQDLYDQMIQDKIREEFLALTKNH